MKIKWLGHATFLITSDAGVRIITDPYKTSANLTYGEITESADVVTVSHEHGDHNNVAAVAGNPVAVRNTARVKGIQFKATLTHHDDAGGSKRGNNTIFSFDVDGLKVCHLGDLGHPLSGSQVAEIGKVDILLAPVGGNYTIDARVATEIAGQLAARVIIPMHYNNERCSTFPVAGVDDFLQRKPRVSRRDTSEVEFKPGEPAEAAQIIVLQPAL